MTHESLLEFPCDFPIKVMGETRPEFAQTILEIIVRHAPDFDATRMEMKTSRHNKYLSLTCVIRATSRLQLDNLYRELSGHPMVKVVL